MAAAWLRLLVVVRAAASASHHGHHPCVVDGAATASCFGFDATDATEILQGALDLPSVRTLTIDNPAVSTEQTPCRRSDHHHTADRLFLPCPHPRTFRV